MKKFLTLLVSIAVLLLVTTSCRSTKECPAYGEVDKFKIDRPR